MTTVVPFTPSPRGPFQFQPTLDGVTYNAVVTWNLFGQRYYISLFTLDGTPVFNLPLIGSESAVNLSSLSWSLGVVTATIDVSAPAYSTRRLKPGRLINLTVSGAEPDAYNGQIQAVAQSQSTFTYPLPGANPGPVTNLGTVSYDISLTSGYFNSTLVFRQFSNTFEINP